MALTWTIIDKRIESNGSVWVAVEYKDGANVISKAPFSFLPGTVKNDAVEQIKQYARRLDRTLNLNVGDTGSVGS